jgi:cytochrome o ubiquinol oxidase subunit 3
MIPASPDAMKAKHDKAELGFWLYLMTDMILFASLFATFMVLRGNTAGGPTGRQLFDPQYAFIETIVLLVSSFTCGLALLLLRYGRKTYALAALGMTVLLGLAFVSMELSEFTRLVSDGNSWQVSAFLSAFFTLVATHGLHVSIGIVWAIVLSVYIYSHGTTANAIRKFTLFSLFWHFLDLVWVFLFAIVYLIGGLS